MTKVLLVEDQEDNRDMLSRRLKKRGYEVRIAVDGAEGLEMAGSESPDLILMDMSLPVIDGWEATRRLKADEATRIAGWKQVDRHIAEQGYVIPLLQYVQPIVHRDDVTVTPHIANFLLPQLMTPAG